MPSRIAAALTATLCWALALVAPAHAAFPGANGKIAFASNRDFSDPANCVFCPNEIYTMNADGTNQTRLTNNTTDDAYPPGRPTGPRLPSSAAGTATSRSTR